MWDAIRNPVSERWRGRGKPPHFDRLRWWMGWHGGSRGKVRRMRAGPVVPVGLAWRWGRNSRHKLAGITPGNWFSLYGKIAREERFWPVVKRRGGQNNPMWRKTLPWGIASASNATHYR